MLTLKPVVNLIRDLETYDLVLSSLAGAIKHSKALDVSITKNKIDKNASCSVYTQDIKQNQGVHPRIYTNHGVSTTKAWGKYYSTDYYVVPSDFWADEVQAFYEEKNKEPTFEVVKGIGWTKMDTWIIRKSIMEKTRKPFLQGKSLDYDTPLIVFAPTFKKKSKWRAEHSRKWTVSQVMSRLSSIPKTQVIGSRHQMDDTREHDSRFYLFKNQDLVDVFLFADVVVADSGSLVYECAAMDIPIVLLDNPDYDDFFKIRARTYDGTIDVGPKATLKELTAAVKSQLKKPDEYKQERRKFGSMVAGPTDCRCSVRFVKFLEKLLL